MFAWKWAREVLVKPLIDRMGTQLMMFLIGFGMTQSDATKVTLGAIAFVAWLLDVAIIHIEKRKEGKI